MIQTNGNVENDLNQISIDWKSYTWIWRVECFGNKWGITVQNPKYSGLAIKKYDDLLIAEETAIKLAKSHILSGGKASAIRYNKYGILDKQLF